jgi:nucleotide-binding universal stress UspA family protein
MSLKDVLVIVDNDPACASRLDVALGLAEAHQAHLTGLHVMPWPAMPVYTEIPIPESADTMQRFELEQAAQRATTLFHERARHTAVRTECRVAEGHVVDMAVLHARYADLTVVGQGLDLGPASGELGALPEELALGVGRPVLVVPRYGTFATVGVRPLVAWNGSREATRAVHDALPLLARAERVTVLSIDPDGRSEPRVPGADIALHLARHGVTVETTTGAGADISVGDVLLSCAADRGADLIVMGAYGHTRLREMVLGGATRHLLRHMTVPVLLSH